ncbi:MAG: glycosyltransferase family 87 protein, partial [Burkholderiales bacterium]
MPKYAYDRLSALGWVAGAAIVALCFAVSPNYDWYPERTAPYAGDFVHEYAAGWLVRTGDPARVYDLGRFTAAQHDPGLVGFSYPGDQFFQALHPPFYYQWVEPLSLLDFRTAAHVWAALGVAALVASIALLSDQWLRPWLGWLVALSIFYIPVAETLVSGQKSTLLLLLFTCTYLLLASGKPVAAGAVFGCIALKPQLLLVVSLVMLSKREWRFVAGIAVAGVLLGAQSLLMGWDACTAWLASIKDPFPQAKLVGRSHSWLGFVQLLTSEGGGPLVLGLTAVLILATGVVLFRLLRGRFDYGSRRFAVQFSAMVLATPLVSPYLYKTYDMAIFVLPLVLLAREIPATRPERRIWLIALALVFAMGGLSPELSSHLPVQL